MIEKNLENKLKKYLKSRNIFFIKTFGNGIQKKGLPDIIFTYKNCFFAIELKLSKNKVSLVQKGQILNIIKSKTDYVFIIDEENIDRFIALLEEENYEKIIWFSKESLRKYQII